MSLVKIGPKHQVVIPKDVFAKLRLRAGDYVEITSDKKGARIRPKQVVDRYTDEPIGPKTRASIRQALKEVKEGKTFGPFDSAEQLIDDLRRRSGLSRRKA